VRCLSIEGCDCDVSLLELERVLPPQTLETLTQTETLNAVLGTPIDDLVKCHSCGIPTIFERCEGNTVFQCPNCNASTCLLCGHVAHPEITCEELQLQDPTVLIQAKMNEALVRICPNCKAQFMKELGCNRMECPRCHTWFCYYCRQLIPKDVGYQHFWRGKGKKPPGACPLFINNRKFNKLAVESRKAEMELLFTQGKKQQDPSEADDTEEEEEQ
jgi:TRIAD3 protein (E3 ubiquitin-protein ligase RNF216)